MDPLPYPPRDKAHALILAMSNELRILRELCNVTTRTAGDMELRRQHNAAYAETQRAAIAVGCRPESANRDN